MKIRIAFLLSLYFILPIADVQGQRDKEFSTEYVMGGGEETLLEDAEWFFGVGDYGRALPIFVKLNRRYPGTNAYKYYTGICYLQKTDEQEKSISYLEAAYSREPKLTDILFYLGKAYMVTYQFDEAIGYFKLAQENKKTSPDKKELIPRLIEQCNNAKLIKNQNSSEDLVLENIGAPVNTQYDEYVPLVSSDESVLIYTYKGKRSTGGLINIYGEADPDGMFYEDIFGAFRLGNKWLDPDGLGSRINSNYHDASIALAPNGLSMFIYKDEGGGDIYISRRVKNTWIRPEPVMGEVNSKYYEGHVSLTVDEMVMFFISDRPGGFGGQDIYQATRQEDETWGDITNLGPTINTPYDEDAPFIHANNKLLYFSSKGHNSMGGYDIFYSTFEDRKWTPPNNIGPPVNTPNDDNFYVVSANGERAYFSSARAGGLGGQDIYIVKPGVFGKKPVLALIKGIVENNGRSLEASIHVTNTTTNEAYGNYKSNAASGNYLIALPPGYDYQLDFILKGEVLHSENVDISDLGVFVEVDHDFELSAKKNPFIDSTNILQNLLADKIAEIEAVKQELALEKELQDTIIDTQIDEIAKLYLLDANGDIIMSSLKDSDGQFNFTGQVIKDEYSMLLDSRISSVNEEIIVLVTDADGNEKLITTTVVVATAEQVALLEGSKVLVTQDAIDEAARLKAEREARDKAEAESRARAAEEARLKAEEEARLKAEDEARLRAEEEARLKAEAEAMALLDEEARIRAEEEARLKAKEEARLRAEEEARLKAEAEAMALLDEEARLRAEEARLKVEEEARLKAEAEALALLGEQERLKAMEEAKRKAAAEAARVKAEAEANALTNTQRDQFSNILFDFDKATLRAKSKKELDAVLLYLSINVADQIIISGHADAIGTKRYNQKLSERRTQKAAAYLIDRGIKETQLVLYAYGKTKPITANTNSDGSDNPNGRQANRRAEFTFSSSPNELDGGKLLAFSRRVANESTIASHSGSFKGTFYKVQVAAYKNAQKYNHSKLDDLGQVAGLDVDGITRFTLGKFDNLKEARKFKRLIVKKGSADAFITAEVDGERKYLNELNSAPTMAKSKTPKIISPAAMAAYNRIMDKFGDERVPGLEFNVQVAAFKQAENYKGVKVKLLGVLKSKKLDDQITRFTIGSFRTLKEAEEFKRKVLEKGTNDAFVTAKYNGQRVLVKDLIANNFYAL